MSKNFSGESLMSLAGRILDSRISSTFMFSSVFSHNRGPLCLLMSHASNPAAQPRATPRHQDPIALLTPSPRHVGVSGQWIAPDPRPIVEHSVHVDGLLVVGLDADGAAT